MSVQKRGKAWRVRWQEGSRWRSRTFTRKADAVRFDDEIRRLRRLGSLAAIDSGSETLHDYATGTWADSYARLLAPKTRALYAGLYDRHLSTTLGAVRLRDLTPELIARWQAERLATGAGPVAVAKALTLLGNILQRAVEGGHLLVNPQRLVRRSRPPRRPEVRPLAPDTVEAMRHAASARDATLMSVLAYAGLRPGEALGLRWTHVRERTILVEGALSGGVFKATKTGAARTVRLLAPLGADLREWRMRSGRPSETTLVFPSKSGQPWTEAAWQSWRRHAFARALDAAGVQHARPYDLRHSFASLLLHEGRSVVYTARQLGHDATLTLRTYGHVIDELEDAPQLNAEVAISEAREAIAARGECL